MEENNPSESSEDIEDSEIESTSKEVVGTVKNLETNVEGSTNDNKTESDSNISTDDEKLNESSSTVDSTSEYATKNVTYEGDLAIYTDAESGYQYQWDKDKNEWVPRQNKRYSFENDTHVYTDADGLKYFWDKEKSAWFPKIDDDFMAQYQMNYGFTNNEETSSTNTLTKPVEKKEAPPKDLRPKLLGDKRKASEPTWFEVDASQNTNVYVQNLPKDTTEEEFVDLMQKCGLVMRDPVTQKFKIKLYKEPGTDYLKGDALCTYIRVESVELALSLIDGYVHKGSKLSVERAKFQMKGEKYDPTLKPKMRKKKEKQKLKKMQEKLFDWRPEKQVGDRSKNEKVVIVKNLFDPDIFDKDVSLILEFQQDLREESAKLGEVRKVIIYDRHPEGVAQINMSSAEEADEVVKLMNGRWFMKRQLAAETWDGKTKYKIAETDSQITKRMETWDKYLEDDEEGKKS